MHKIALTIDVEDWFCVRNMQDTIPAESWDACEQRVDVGLDFVLEELEKRSIHATFFVLGWISERHPKVVEKIASAGHEIGSHGYSHRSLDEMTPKEFDEDLKKSLRKLNEITQKRVLGFRAPSFSVTEKTLWALEVLKQNKLAYDSSIYPVKHPNYGIPSFPDEIQLFRGIIEAPMTSYRLAGIPIPISGGGYFRLYPYALTRFLLARVLEKRNAILYFHPWEFDSNQPRVSTMTLGKQFRHYTGLRKNREKFRRLLNDFEFCTLQELLVEKGFDIAGTG